MDKKLLECLENFDEIDGCHVFRKRNEDGYGYITLNGKNFAAHRIAFEKYHGKIPEEKMICHKCNNPGCIKIEHLYCGDAKSNAADRTEKYGFKLSESKRVIFRVSESFFTEIKIMAILTKKTMSAFIRLAIQEQIKRVKEKHTK